MNGISATTLLLCAWSALGNAQQTSEPGRHSPVFVEKVSLDWDHSGTPTTFTLSYQHRTDGAGDADRLVIRRNGEEPWILLNNDDEWTSLKSQMTSELVKQNVVSSTRMLFIKSGPEPDARTYLILKGGGYGCCVGSLTVITSGKNGAPRIVFHAPEHLLEEIIPEPGGRIALIGQSSDSEARATRNAQSYDPYRVYIVQNDQFARFDLERSKAYNLKNYCEWAGPTYNEKFIAVNVDPGQWGAGHCRTMTEEQFEAFQAKHRTQFAGKD